MVDFYLVGFKILTTRYCDEIILGGNMDIVKNTTELAKPLATNLAEASKLPVVKQETKEVAKVAKKVAKPAAKKAKKIVAKKKAVAKPVAAKKEVVVKAKNAKKAPVKKKVAVAKKKAKVANKVADTLFITAKPSADNKHIIAKVVVMNHEQLNKAAKQIFKNLDEVHSLNKDSVGAVVRSFGAVSKCMEDMGKLAMNYVDEALENSLAASKNMLNVKSIKDLHGEHSIFAKKHYEHFIGEANRLSEISMKAISDAVKPINEHINTVLKKVTKK